ncbi:MAG TPA: hypothetical protein VJM11_02360, partial [Nevskiaceae bacterium]|nr:hypothetical protein [Nevskiaceae bacterium]
LAVQECVGAVVGRHPVGEQFGGTTREAKVCDESAQHRARVEPVRFGATRAEQGDAAGDRGFSPVSIVEIPG